MIACKYTGKMYGKPSSATCVFIIIFALVFSLSACNSKTPVVTPPAKSTGTSAPGKQAMLQTQTAKTEDLFSEEGYIYERRDRRDPFVPLIMPSEKVHKMDKIKIGTLESYDLAEFSLAAIAKKGSRYYALLVTPDNRSFTVSRGTTIGLNRGKVKNISKDKVVLVEYLRDYKGDLESRQITLEFNKGEE